MKNMVALCLLLLLVLTAQPARADLLVLVHGYSASALSWEESGVSSVLEAKGWPRAGMLSVMPDGGVSMLPAAGVEAANKVYIVNLPSEAPIPVQTAHLEAMLNFLNQRHPKEALILAGHSAGGIVARLALVKSGGPGVKALISIASPHLGTPRAEEALDVTAGSGPFEIVKDFFGGDTYQYLKYSQPLYWDIVRPYPGTLLFWLNQQAHPDIKYYSVVRTTPFHFGDFLVPGESMDMNNIPALRGRSKVFTTQADHSLVPEDGLLLVQILTEVNENGKSKETSK